LQFNSLIVLAKSGIVLAIAIFIIVAFAVGYLLGGPNLDTRLTEILHHYKKGLQKDERCEKKGVVLI
jgi:hypothetical protein